MRDGSVENAMFSTHRLYSDRYSIYPLASADRRRGAERGQVPACTEACVVPECQALGRLLTQERAAAAAKLRVSQSDQSGGGGSTACTQESCGGVSSFCRKKSLRSIVLQNPSNQGAYSLTYQSTHWGIRSIGSESKGQYYHLARDTKAVLRVRSVGALWNCCRNLLPRVFPFKYTVNQIVVTSNYSRCSPLSNAPSWWSL